MNKEEMKILSYLSDNLGNGGNILEMSEGINKRYGPAYYSNIYNTIKKLKKMGIIAIEPEGKNRLIKLDMGNPFSTYYMSEMENHKASQITIPKEILGSILGLAEKSNIFSICALETEKYLKMNRIEILFLTRKHNEDDRLIESLLRIESAHSIRIDPIILTIDEFIKIMEADELSPIKDLILNKYILYNSDGFWGQIKRHRINAKYKKLNKFPQDITREELAYNYNRFGYRLHEEIKPSDKISLETVIFSMSIKEEARIKYGAIILLYKNIESINWAYLFYMYKRYEELSRFKSILLSLAYSNNLKSNTNIDLYANLIPGKPDTPYDNKIIKKYIELYD
jgi:hypothetical protein